MSQSGYRLIFDLKNKQVGDDGLGGWSKTKDEILFSGKESIERRRRLVQWNKTYLCPSALSLCLRQNSWCLSSSSFVVVGSMSGLKKHLRFEYGYFIQHIKLGLVYGLKYPAKPNSIKANNPPSYAYSLQKTYPPD
ncbi:hypothetical protein CEXT_287111 [Caerostris extrusa]|uniref:Uncharacterized protein n=1 Tax=Caerostris extrusa TaxID=172846 RepID=A0AAV4VCS9_CAEEX|nr:hypothetical protein CEXT_287111 [Caerostris extrusa]